MLFMPVASRAHRTRAIRNPFVNRLRSYFCAGWLAFVAGISAAATLSLAHAQVLTPGTVVGWGNA
jgi:hypothetical protein